MSTSEETSSKKKAGIAMTVIRMVTAKHHSLFITKNTCSIPCRALPSPAAPKIQPPGFPLAECECSCVHFSENDGCFHEPQTLHKQFQTQRSVIQTLIILSPLLGVCYWLLAGSRHTAGGKAALEMARNTRWQLSCPTSTLCSQLWEGTKHRENGRTTWHETPCAG